MKSALESLQSIKEQAFTVVLEPIIDSAEPLALKCRPVKYLDNLKSVKGKMDLRSFSRFQGSGSDVQTQVFDYLEEYGDEAFESLEISARLQVDMYLVKGIANIPLVYDNEKENDEQLEVGEFKALIIAAYGQDEFQKLLDFILEISGVQTGKKRRTSELSS